MPARDQRAADHRPAAGSATPVRLSRTADFAPETPQATPGQTDSVLSFSIAGAQIETYQADRPTRFGRYELRRLLGKGGMGEVWEAFDTKLERTVALKRILGAQALNPEALARFQREAKTLAALDHPNILPLLDHGDVQGVPFFTMPLAAGGSLHQRREECRGNPRLFVACFLKVVDAVHHLHEKGRLHRDLKPSNLLFGDDEKPFVADFGLARLAEAEDQGLTNPGAVVGTLPYMAPEQVTGKLADIDRRTDIWALGVILYEVLAGKRPFAGEDQETLAGQIVAAAPERPRQLNPKLDANLERIILHCLKKQPHERYATAAQLAEDLKRWQQGRWLKYAPWIDFTTRAVAITTSRLSLSAAALVALSFALFFAFNRPKPPTEEEQFLERIKPLQERFAQGETVELIGATGPPKAGWLAVGQHARELLHDTVPFTVRTRSRAFLEVFRCPPGSQFHLEAEMKFTPDGSTPACGCFVGHLASSMTRTTRHAYCVIEAARSSSASAGERWAGGARFFSFHLTKGELPTGYVSKALPGNAIAGEPFGKWSRIELELGAHALEGTVQSTEAARLPWPLGFQAELASYFPEAAVAKLPGGVGLYACQGEVAVRNLQIRRLSVVSKPRTPPQGGLRPG